TAEKPELKRNMRLADARWWCARGKKRHMTIIERKARQRVRRIREVCFRFGRGRQFGQVHFPTTNQRHRDLKRLAGVEVKSFSVLGDLRPTREKVGTGFWLGCHQSVGGLVEQGGAAIPLGGIRGSRQSASQPEVSRPGAFACRLGAGGSSAAAEIITRPG